LGRDSNSRALDLLGLLAHSTIIVASLPLREGSAQTLLTASYPLGRD
jgi:hypothetical protein